MHWPLEGALLAVIEQANYKLRFEVSTGALSAGRPGIDDDV
jgi:hypothetical protein